MDRMQPPPNYYGTPYPNPNVDPSAYKQPYVGPQPPQPNQPITPSNQPIPQPDVYEQMYNGQGNLTPVSYYLGKRMKIYCSFPDSSKWHDVIFEGTLIEAAADRMIIRNVSNNMVTIIVGVYINYIEMME